MIEVINITKKFDSFTSIEDMSFDVPDGSIYGLIGYNGAGKTTILKTIAGVYKAEDGIVLLDGANVFDNAEEKKDFFMFRMKFSLKIILLWKKWQNFIMDFIRILIINFFTNWLKFLI